MKYEFHAGDYVEAVDGFVGWVYRAKDDYIEVTNKDSAFACRYYVPEQLTYFKRIGQYEFIKKSKDKIEPLCEEYTESFPIYKTTTTSDASEWTSIDIGAVSKKINELVEAVNRLEEKTNEMAQSRGLSGWVR